MYDIESNGKRPEKNKDENEETLPKKENGSNNPGQDTEESHRVTPTDPDIVPKDTTRDAKDRWESESPAVKGHPQQNIPDPDPDGDNKKKHEQPDKGEPREKKVINPEELDDDDLLKKRDETGIA